MDHQRILFPRQVDPTLSRDGAPEGLGGLAVLGTADDQHPSAVEGGILQQPGGEPGVALDRPGAADPGGARRQGQHWTAFAEDRLGLVVGLVRDEQEGGRGLFILELQKPRRLDHPVSAPGLEFARPHAPLGRQIAGELAADGVDDQSPAPAAKLAPEVQRAAESRAFVDDRRLPFGRVAEQRRGAGAGDHREAGVVDLVVEALEHPRHEQGVLAVGRREEQDGEWAGGHVALITAVGESIPVSLEES